MQVKPLSDEYIDEFVDVVDEYREFCGFERDKFKTTEFFQRVSDNHEAVTFLAISDKNEVMGFVNLYPSYSTLALKRIWILNDLGVSSKFRRLGVANVLIDKVLEYARSTNAIRVELKTGADNFNAQKLYSKLGFKIDKSNVYYRVPVD